MSEEPSASIDEQNADSSVDPVNEPAPAWHESLSEETRAIEGADQVFEKFKDVDSLVSGYMNAEKLARSKSEGIKVPGEDASDAEREEFYKALGRPESPDGYDITEFTEGDEAPFASEELQPVVEALHAKGLNQDQVAAVLKIGAENLSSGQDAFVEMHKEMASETDAQLREEWGDKYHANMAAVKTVAEKFEVLETLKETGLANHKPIIDMLHKVSSLVSEDSLPVPSSSSGQTPQETRSELMKHPAYMNKTHRDHNRIMQQINATYR